MKVTNRISQIEGLGNEPTAQRKGDSERALPRYEQPSYQIMKRIFDLVVCSLGLIILSPLFLIISLVVLLDDGFPVIYKNKRIGRNGKEFYAYKFRSMKRNAEEILRNDPELMKQFQEGFKIANDPRLLKCGKFIRETSLDELPQLINVMRGEMSLVGPRPILVMEAERYEGIETYYRMIPGCAGLWQCSGRSEVDYSTRLKLNREYYETASIRTDLVILLRTVKSVLKREGAV